MTPSMSRRPVLFLLAPLLLLLAASSVRSIERCAVENAAGAGNSLASGEASNCGTCAEDKDPEVPGEAETLGYECGAEGDEKSSAERKMDGGYKEEYIWGKGEEEELEAKEEHEEVGGEEDGSKDSKEDSSSNDEEEESDHSASKDVIDLGVPQNLSASRGHLRSKFDEYLARMERYVKHEVAEADDEELAAVLPRCKNHREKCVQFAMDGKCETDTAWMHRRCAPACAACDMLIYERRCPYDPKLPPAWYRGELNAMFERIVSDDAYAKYEPRVWSRPTLVEDDEEGKAEYQVGGPWIVTLENVLTEEETDRIVKLGKEDGFRRSDDEGVYLPDGSFKAVYTEGRTSYNSWCRHCHDDEHGRAVLGKIEDITHIPRKHFADLQILRYEKTQKYELHHDYDFYSIPRQPGPRIMTFFLYLSDVEEGGGTDFPLLNLTFTPKRGRALLWPNVLDENPNRRDRRTKHQALPVVNGTKYAANAWIHQHDWQGPKSRKCSG